MIVDSGTRREFDTGAVRDIQEGKGRCDLLPLGIIGEIYSNEFCDEVVEIMCYIEDFKKTNELTFLKKTFAIFAVFAFDDFATALLELSKHFEEGAKKYGEYNWQKGIPTHCYIDSAIRHYLKFLRGDKDERHDRAFLWNIICCIWTCENKPELNDYAPKVDKEEQ